MDTKLYPKKINKIYAKILLAPNSLLGAILKVIFLYKFKDKTMTNEQTKAKELAELLTAFSNGKQFLLNSVTGWIDFKFETVEEIILYFHTPENIIRIKPETKRVALTQQDLIDRELRKETMRVKFNGTSMLITDFNDTGAWISGEKHEYEAFMFCYTFLDGTPCYKEVDCE